MEIKKRIEELKKEADVLNARLLEARQIQLNCTNRLMEIKGIVTELATMLKTSDPVKKVKKS